MKTYKLLLISILIAVLAVGCFNPAAKPKTVIFVNNSSYTVSGQYSAGENGDGSLKLLQYSVVSGQSLTVDNKNDNRNHGC